MRDPITVVTWLSISVLVALAGPFDTFSTMSPLTRVIFCSLLLGGAIITVMGVCEVVKRITGDQRTIARDLKVAVLFAGSPRAPMVAQVAGP